MKNLTADGKPLAPRREHPKLVPLLVYGVQALREPKALVIHDWLVVYLPPLKNDGVRLLG